MSKTIDVCSAGTLIKFRKETEFVIYPTTVLDEIWSLKNVPDGAKLAWQVLYERAKFSPEIAIEISYSALAKKLGKTPRTVQKYVKKLAELGFLVIRNNFKEFLGQTVNTFFVRLPSYLEKKINTCAKFIKNHTGEDKDKNKTTKSDGSPSSSTFMGDRENVQGGVKESSHNIRNLDSNKNSLSLRVKDFELTEDLLTWSKQMCEEESLTKGIIYFEFEKFKLYYSDREPSDWPIKWKKWLLDGICHAKQYGKFKISTSPKKAPSANKAVAGDLKEKPQSQVTQKSSAIEDACNNDTSWSDTLVNNKRITSQMAVMINILFARAVTIWGKKFSYTVKELLVMKSEWALALSANNICPHKAKLALDNYIKEGVKWFPSLPEFIEKCKASSLEPLPTEGQAYQEYISSLNIQDKTEVTWSHPIVYWTIQEIGIGNLARMPSFQAQKSFRETFERLKQSYLQGDLTNRNTPAMDKIKNSMNELNRNINSLESELQDKRFVSLPNYQEIKIGIEAKLESYRNKVESLNQELLHKKEERRQSLTLEFGKSVIQVGLLPDEVLS